MDQNGRVATNGSRVTEESGNAMPKSFNNDSSRRKRKTSAKDTSNKGVTLVFKDVCVTLNKNNILKKVCGMAKVGQTLAVMGPSGAGKSTLLNTLTGRIPVKSGSVTLNNTPVDRHLRRKISYVMQADIFYPTLTLKETLTFQTLLRLPESMPKEMKMAKMKEIVDALELNKCFNTQMGGTFLTGLSGGEKKRASIACELLTNPKLLILDEPTSGLDSAIAYSLMASLDKYAKQSYKTVVTTIHQPSSQIFHMFTNILLLHDGEVAYFGPGSKIVDFFANLGMHCEPHYNPADFILEQLKASSDNVRNLITASQGMRNTIDWPVELRDDEFTIVVDTPSNYRDDEVTVFSDNDIVVAKPSSTLDEIQLKVRVVRQLTESDKSDVVVNEVDIESYIDTDATWQTGFFTQYVVLSKRNFLRQKGRYFSKLNFTQVLFMAVFAGLVWFQTPRNEETARDRLGILFFMAVQFGFLPAMDAVTALNDDTGVFMRERSAGLYRLSAYYLAVMTTEIPVAFILPTLYVIINYWMVNLMPDGVNFVGIWLILVLATYVAQSIGMLISIVITSRAFVMSFTNTFLIFSLLGGGYYNTTIASWFRWIKYLSYLSYTLSALSTVEFTDGANFTCSTNNIDYPTQYPTYCDYYNNGTLRNDGEIPGYLFLETWDISGIPLYANLLAMAGFIIVCRVAAYFVLRFLRRPKT